MNRLSLAIFQQDCCGCHACEVACKQEHQLASGDGFVKVLEKSPRFVPVYCHHCPKAPCVDSCPVKALYRDERGVVLVDDKQCIGCRECVSACPFGAMGFHQEKEVAAKCDLCSARIQEGRAPACASVCPTGCILWGESTARLLKEKKLAMKRF